jgi:hypothetical protein
MRATQCAECGYYGPALETHALYAVLQEDVEHARELTEDMHTNERAAADSALDELAFIIRRGG